MEARARKTASPFSAPPSVHGADLLFFGQRWREERHDTPVCEFQWLRRGRSVLEMDGRRQPAAADDFLLIPRSTPHRDVFDAGAPYEVLLVMFTWFPWEEELFRRLTPGTLGALPSETRREAAYLLDRLFAAAARRRAHGRALVNALFHAALLLLLSAAETGAGTDVPAPEYVLRRGQWLTEEAKHYIANHFHRHLTAADVAAALGVSEFHLARQFAAAAGESLHGHLLAQRFARAETLLLEGRLTVAQVAHATGFANGGYFAKAFKKRYGRTPKAFLALHPARNA